MVSFLLTVKRMLTGLRHSFKDKRFRSLFLTTLLILLSGTLFYHEVEHFSFLDALYFSVMTLTTVGTAELGPATAFGKVFTMIYTLAGIGVVFGFVFYIAKGIHFSKEDKDEKKNEKKDEEKPAGKSGKGAPRSHG